jgi:hypothetical protein
MRRLVLIALFALGACSQATATRVDDRTFHIEGPGTPGGSDAPNRHLADQLCPKGYRVVDSIERRNTPDGYRDEPGVFTNWTIRCI